MIRTSLIVAGEYAVPLTGIEVVFYTQEADPWLALTLTPPWDENNDLKLYPLHPDYIKQLMEAGLITPTPRPTY